MGSARLGDQGLILRTCPQLARCLHQYLVSFRYILQETIMSKHVTRSDDEREKVQPAEERGERTENALAIARGGKSEGEVPGATPSTDNSSEKEAKHPQMDKQAQPTTRPSKRAK
jgi:hypothetical protein